jgi:hypothetical protein
VVTAQFRLASDSRRSNGYTVARYLVNVIRVSGSYTVVCTVLIANGHRRFGRAAAG